MSVEIIINSFLKKALPLPRWGIEGSPVWKSEAGRGTGRLSEALGKYLSGICDREQTSLGLWKYFLPRGLGSLGVAARVGGPQGSRQFNLKVSSFCSKCRCVSWVEGTLGALITLTLNRATKAASLGVFPAAEDQEPRSGLYFWFRFWFPFKGSAHSSNLLC